MQRIRGAYSSGRYAATTENIVTMPSSAPTKPTVISSGSAVRNSATSGNIHTAQIAHPIRQSGRRPYRSPSIAISGVTRPLIATDTMMQASIAVRLTVRCSAA